MYKNLLLLVLVAVIHCQDDVDQLKAFGLNASDIAKIFNISTPTTLLPAVNKNPVFSNSAPSVNTTANELSCVLDDGSPGVCVPRHLCDMDNNGEGSIDIRNNNEDACKSYMHTCCTVAATRDRKDPITPSPEPMREGCGWSNPKGADMRTTGETAGETKFGEFPWTVAVTEVFPANYSMMFRGGGSLIHPSVVLTAAHTVFKKNSLMIRAGEWDAQTDDEIHPHQDRDVASIEIHKDFIDGVYHYDVALLFLATPVVLARHIGVVCLPPPRTLPGTRCVSTGWGKDHFGETSKYQVILKKVELPVVERNACLRAFRSTRLGRLFQLHSSFMCAGGEKDKDTCKGDGGSPLSCPIEYEKDRYVQSGIVAWGIKCGGDGIPGAYVDVAIVRDWIDNKMVGRGYSTSIYTY